MKKIFLLLLAFFPFWTFSQVKFSKDSIPVEGNEVVFQVEYDVNITKSEIRERILYYLSNDLNAHSGRLMTNSENKIICRTIDFFPYATAALYYYAVYMRYHLVFEYEDNFCRMIFRNIDFMEKDEYDEMTKNNQPAASESVAYSAKEIMIDKAYKVLFLKNASDKITEHALERINKMAEEVDIIFLKKKYPL